MPAAAVGLSGWTAEHREPAALEVAVGEPVAIPERGTGPQAAQTLGVVAAADPTVTKVGLETVGTADPELSW
jgi:hypothetical protein